jgi:hypothetical protein
MQPAGCRERVCGVVVCYLGGGAADQGEAREVDDGVHDHAAQASGRVEVLLHGAGEVQAARVDAHHLIHN